jgi:hypothetical protein
VSPTSTTVSGSVSWEVSSSVSVNHVNFSIDGGPVAWVEYFAPYFFKGDSGMFDTRALPDGQHTLTAVGVGVTGTIVASGSKTITVANASTLPPPPPASTLGRALPARMPESTGTEYYVDGGNGSDLNPGTRTAPWRSINKALASVPLNGSIINVRAGTYVGQVAYNGRNADPSNPITLRAYPGEHVLLTAPPTSLFNAVWVYNGGGIRIRGFEITGPTSNNGIRVENAHDVEVTNCDIHDNGHMGVQVVGTGTGGNRNIQLWSSRLHRNGGAWIALDPYWVRGDHGVYWGAVSSNYDGVDHTSYGGVVADNVFYDQPYGRELQIGSEVSGLIVTNNTFYDAFQPDDRAGTGIAFYGEGTAYDPRYVVVVNNIVGHNAHTGVSGSGGYDPVMRTNVVRNNLAWDNPDGDFDNTYDSATQILFTLGTNFTGANPLLVDPSHGNMQLGAGSPAIGRADPAYAPPIDFYGKPRLSTPDLGAVAH